MPPVIREYLELGWPLVPISHGSKGPRHEGWNKREHVIVEPREAERITKNVGLAHAYCSPTPTMALDIDDIDGARAWIGQRGVVLDGLLDAEDAVQIVSGKPGRAKLLFRLPQGPLPSIAVKGADGRVLLEFRCASRDGLTVQDVLPPSIHPETGRPYRWGGKGDWRALPVIPPELLAVWDAERAKATTKQRGSASTSRAVDDTPRRRAQVMGALAAISADCAYEVYRDVTWAIMSLGWTDSEALARSWCLTAPERFDEDSFATIVRDWDETRTPGLGTLLFLARKGAERE